MTIAAKFIPVFMRAPIVIVSRIIHEPLMQSSAWFPRQIDRWPPSASPR